MSLAGKKDEYSGTPFRNDLRTKRPKDLRPFINKDRPQTPEQVFSTNFYHKTFGTPELCKEEVTAEELKGANSFTMLAFKAEGQERSGVINMSDCGTGKTRGVLDFLCDLKVADKLPPVIVLAPLSILEPAWGGDIYEWTPDLTFEPCYAQGREKSAKLKVDIHLFNHDAIKWIMKQENKHIQDLFKGAIVIIDEFTAYKNIEAQRTQQAINFSKLASMVIELSGTPMPKSVLDIFTPAMIADGGTRLGKSFYRFRAQVCTPEPLPFNPRAKKWIDKPDAISIVTQKLGGICFRFEARDVPLNTKRYMTVKLPPKAIKAYKEMVAMDLMYNEDGTSVNAVNAAARYTKLLQLCTGAVYNSDGDIISFHKERYELVATLVKEVKHSIIGFNFKHERDYLKEIFKKQGISYAVIDGSVKVKERVQIVKDYQAGMYDTLICHPQSAGHGLTFTKGTRTIWCSLTNNAEYFLQYNKRIDRKGQTRETETIMIGAEGTKELDVYATLFSKVLSQAGMLEIFAGETKKNAKFL